MTFPKNLFLIILLISILPQIDFVEASTQSSIVKKSDILKIDEPTEITESDFVEKIKTGPNNYSWTINIKFGPYPSQNKAQQVAENLIKNQEFLKYPILQKKTNPQDIDFFEDTRTNRDKYSWVVNLIIGPYPSKNKAQQVTKDINSKHKDSINAHLERKLILDKKSLPSKLAQQKTQSVENTQEVLGSIFLSLEATPSMEQSIQPVVNPEFFIEVATKSNSLNVRQTPSVSSHIVSKLRNGTKVSLVDSNVLNGPTNWY
ncbi:uncharacterized protein METZ01_LOCUS337519, partial [marine metagenome]